MSEYDELQSHIYPEKPIIKRMGDLEVVIHPGNAIRIFQINIDKTTGQTKRGRIKLVLRKRDIKYDAESLNTFEIMLAELQRYKEYSPTDSYQKRR